MTAILSGEIWVNFPSLCNPHHPVYAGSGGAENEVLPRAHKDVSLDTSALLWHTKWQIYKPLSLFTKR